MNSFVRSAALIVTLPFAALHAQTPKAPAKTPHAAASAAPKEVPPFAGTWILNTKRSALTKRISGESKAIIQYDGKNWQYIHSHQETINDEPEAWRTTMKVNDPKLHTELLENITFQSRMKSQGDALLFEEWGTTHHGQKIHNTVKYTLSDNGNTLTQAETSVGPLGTEKNVYVLERAPGSAPMQ